MEYVIQFLTGRGNEESVLKHFFTYKTSVFSVVMAKLREVKC